MNIISMYPNFISNTLKNMNSNRKENKSKLRIGYFGYSHLGDTIEIIPFLRNLSQQNAHITYITNDDLGKYQLINTPYINRLLLNRNNFYDKISFYIKILFGHFDYIIICYAYIGAPLWYILLLYIITFSAKHITYYPGKLANKKAICFDTIIDSNNKSILEVYKKIFEYIYGNDLIYNNELEIFIKRKNELPFIDKLFVENNITKNGNNKIIGIFLSGGDVRFTTNGKIHRNRQTEKWIELIQYLCNKGYYIFLIGGKDNIDLAKSVKSKIKSKNLIDCTGTLSIQQSTALISKVNLFICTDSGPLHIAIGFKKKTIALIHKYVNFVGDISNPIYSDNIPGIEVSDVIKEIEKINI